MNINWKIIILIIFLLAGLFRILLSQPAGFESLEVNNGLKVYYQKGELSRYTTLALIFKGGQAAEPPGKSGLSYLTTRLLAEIGDEDRLADLLSAGVSLKVGSQPDFSYVQFDFPTSEFEKVLKLGLTNLNQPIFSEIRIEAIKKALLSEARREKSRLFDSAILCLKQRVFPESSYAASLFGDANSLKSISKKDITRFYQLLMDPDKVRLIIITDLAKDRVDSLLKIYGSILKFKMAKENQSDLSNSSGSNHRSLILNHPKATPPECLYQGPTGAAVLVGYLLPGPLEKNYPMAYLLQASLSGYPGSILWPLRQDKTLSYNPESYLEIINGNILLWTYLETDSQLISRALENLRGIFSRLAENGLSQEEIESSKLMAYTHYQRISFSRDNRIINLALFLANNLQFDFENQLPALIEAVQPSAFNDLIRSVFKPGSAIEIIISSD
ncbi:MAG: M16 family metallopeptidase [Candidatus Saccharicenans sp.]